MSHDFRSTKRRRTSDNPRPILIVSPGEWFKTAGDREVFTRHADFWLDDGNLILLAGAIAFRVFRSIVVKKSAVFADMFAAGSLDATETLDDCPIVRLTDHPEDLRDFLQYLMPCSPLKLRGNGTPLVEFAELHAAIHLAHKYQCPDVETRALFILKKYYTSHFAEYNAYDASTTTLVVPPQSAAIAAINIARLTETPSMLPFAFYLLGDLGGVVMDGYERRDGTKEHLDADDLRRYIEGRTLLAWELASLNDAVFALTPGPQCRTFPRCTRVRESLNEGGRTWARGRCNVLGFHRERILGLGADFGLCRVCKREMLQKEVEERRRVWMLVPEMFDLGADSCNVTSGREEESDSDSD